MAVSSKMFLFFIYFNFKIPKVNCVVPECGGLARCRAERLNKTEVFKATQIFMQRLSWFFGKQKRISFWTTCTEREKINYTQVSNKRKLHVPKQVLEKIEGKKFTKAEI